MSDLVDRITAVLTTPRLLAAGLEAPEIRDLAERVAAELQLTEEHQWVPIAESGSRWSPRKQHEAEAAMVRYPVGDYDYGDHDGGITSITHEHRWASAWSEVQP